MNIAVIIITSIVSLLAFRNRDLFNRMKFNAHEIKHNNDYYRFLSYGLIHADFAHLLINMFVLWSFGRIVETYFVEYFGVLQGRFFYIVMYVAAIGFSTVPAFGRHKDDIYYNAVGASGAVSAVVFASILLDPTTSIMFIFLPIPIPAPVFGLLYLGYSAYMARRGGDNIGHDAHFWGALFGFVFPVILKPQLITLFAEAIYNIF